MNEAVGLEVTCHRAFDQVRDVNATLESLIELGVKRILTSGQAENPYHGMELLKSIVSLAKRRIMIMAAGVNPETVKEIILKTGVDEVHSAAAASRKSAMSYIKSEAQMGHGEDFLMNVVDGNLVREIKGNMAGL